MDGLDVAQDVQPTMCIFHNGKVHAIRPLPGPKGLEDFCTRVADIMQLASPDMVSLAFDCVDPFTGESSFLLITHPHKPYGDLDQVH